MNILYICNEYPPGKCGGIGSATRNLAEEMIKNGHRVFVAGLYMPGYGQKDYEETGGIMVWRRRLNIDIGIIGNNYSAFHLIGMYFLRSSGILSRSLKNAVAQFISFLHKLIINYKIDIIEWPDFNECFEYAHPIVLPADFAVPVVVKLHGTDSYIKQQTNRPFDLAVFEAEKKHIMAAFSLIGVSNYTARQYLSFYNIDKEITVLHNSISNTAADRQVKPDKCVIVFAGSVNQFKGVGSLMEAWNIVHIKHPYAILQIFGKGRPGKFIELLDKEAKDSVKFMGFTDSNKIKQAFSNAIAAVFPSYTECFSLAPLEAMAAGCPVIFTERASGPELVTNGKNGLLVNPADSTGIAKAINHLITDHGLQTLFSEKGKQTIEQKFNIIDSARAHLNFYQTVIEKFKREKVCG
jgi:glycosyltransferase involved in cell wall biosynthesis